MEIFDKAKYHADGNFPSGLPREQAYVPGGMFIAWCALADLLSEEIRRQFSAECVALNERTSSPCSLYRAFGGVFTDAHLSRKGIDFAKAYFDLEHGAYLDDYIDLLANEEPTAYHVADTWRNFDLLRSILDSRYSDWKDR
jgi:hypothetical protein